MRKLCCLTLMIAIATVFGCKKGETEEASSQLVDQAQSHMKKGEWDKAEEKYKEALDDDPTLAVAHRDLARLYQQRNKNLAHALYHYDRFFELQPDSELMTKLKAEKDKVKEALLTELVDTTTNGDNLKNNFRAKDSEIAGLKSENARLQKMVEDTREMIRSVRANTTRSQTSTRTPTTTTTTTARTSSTTPSSSDHQIYTTEKGDTLSTISTKFYGTSGKWLDIYEANKDTLSSPDKVKEGQTLVIPAVQ